METDIQIKLTVPERNSQSGDDPEERGDEQTGGETGNGGNNTGSETGGDSSNQANTGGGNSTSGSENPSGNTGSEIAESQTRSESGNGQSVSLQENQGNSLASTNNSNTLSSTSNKYSIAVPNTGGKTSDNHGSVALTTTFAFLVIILGIVFLAKRIKNKHRSSRKSKKSSFVIKHNPLKLAMTSLALLAVAFFGISFFAHAMKDSSASAAGDDEWSFGISVGNSAELGRGGTGATTHTVTLPSNSSVEWRFSVQANSSTLNLDGKSSNPGIPSVDGENQALEDSTWGYSVSKNENADITGAVWSQIPTTETTIRSSNDGDENGSSFYIHYGAKIAADESKDNLGPGSYSTSITYSVVADNATPTLGTMQDFTADECTAMNTGDSRTLRDLRDDNTYTIKKLADGKCWMTQNLAIMDTIISSEDSNLPSGTTFTVPASTEGWATEGVDYGDGVAESEIKKARLNNDSTYGVVYNYYAATGGGAWYGDGKSQNTIITQDICPKGWRLPTGGAVDASTGNGEFQTLYNNYNSYDLMTDSSGPQFTLSGYHDNGSRYDTGKIGGYWSSTINNSNYAYSVFMMTSNMNMNPDVSYYKYFGSSMRCVAKTGDNNTLSGITYMQDMTPDIIEATPVGASAILTDSRDNKTYTVKKLADGKIWMRDFLKLSNKTISSADSNISSGSFTIPSEEESNNDLVPIDESSNPKTAKVWFSDDNVRGFMYNYYTLSAGTSWYGDGYGSKTLDQDICPKGWHIPSSDNYSELMSKYSEEETFKNESGINNLLNTNTNQFNGRGVGVFIWNSDTEDEENAYEITAWLAEWNNNTHTYNLVDISAGDFDDKRKGGPIQCIAKLDSEKTISDISNMQDINSTIINNTPEGASATLTDSRDNKTYTVKKLADGNIWMTQNLRLVNKTITSEDSNITASSFTVPASTEGWGSESDGNSATSTKTYDTGNTSYGVLYNYATASAGTSWYGGGVDSGNLTQDICPKGWRLPTGGANGEFVALDIAYGGTGENRTDVNTYSSNFTGSDMSFVLPGNYNSGSHNGAGTLGFYWSSSQNSRNDAYNLFLVSSNYGVSPSPQFYFGKNIGLSMRCIAK